MRLLRTGLGISLVFAMAGCANACGGAQRPEAVAETIADAGVEAGKETAKEEKPVPDARIGYAKEKRLCTRLISTKALKEEHCIDTKVPIEQAVWVDRERMGALLDNGSALLWEITSPSAKELSIPPEKSFERPAPLDDKGKVHFGVEASDRRHLWSQPKKGELWLSRCPWWFMFDAGYCDAWVEARLYPSPISIVTNRWGAPGYKGTRRDLPSGSPADGITVEIQQPDGGGDITIVCKNGKTTSTFVEESRGSPLTAEIGWIGENASQYLLRTELDFGEGSSVTLRWMKACSPDAESTLDTTMSGPDAYWIHDDPAGYRARYGAESIGVLAADWIDFSP